jgi:hypothetical protein
MDTDPATPQDRRAILRRLVASIAYRAERVLEDAPPAFADFSPAPDARTPLALMRHVAELLEWSAELLGEARHPSPADGEGPPAWPAARERLRAAAHRLDHALERTDLDRVDIGRLVQGPLADALTHVGQLAYLRRLSGWPMPRQNYFRADMQTWAQADATDAARPAPGDADGRGAPA